MDRIQNKHGPDFDVEFPMTGQPRDGTERNPRDGTEGNPRDGTKRKPRDEIMPGLGIHVIRDYYPGLLRPKGFRIHARPPFNWGISGRMKPVLLTTMPEFYPVVNE